MIRGLRCVREMLRDIDAWLAQALILVNEKGAMSASDSRVSGIMAGTREVFKFPVPLIRSSVLGTIIGIVPGLGINAASFITYVVEKNAAKDKDTFGEGNTKGLIAPQTAIGAVTSSALIPAFALGVPGSSSAALFLSARSIHGIQTGYSFYSKNGDMVSTIIWGMLLAQFAFAILGLLGAKYFAKITEMPKEGRPLVLVPRETPLSPIHLRNLYELSMMGVAVLPPVLTFYNGPQTVDDMVEHIVGKILDRLGIPAEYRRWQG